MTDVSPVQVVMETVVGFVHFLYMLLVGVVKAFLPSNLLPQKSVTGELVLITGSGSGLGRLMAIKFAQKGARLALWDIDAGGNEKTKQLVHDFAPNAEVFLDRVDLSSRDEIYRAAERVKREAGTVDILVNNAGVVTGRHFLSCPDELVEKTMAVNINAHFWTTKSFIGAMLDRNHGHIVSIASMAGKVGVGRLTDYCASKFAAVGFAESLAVEMHSTGKTGVHVTTVCPTYISTGMFDGAKTGGLLLPMLTPEYVVDRIMEAILTNQAVLILPRFAYIVTFVKNCVPWNAMLLLSDYFGATKSMDEFKGRQ